MGSYTYHDFLFYLKKAGHTCKTVYYHFPDKFHDDFFCERFSEYLSGESCDVVVSVNFFPLVAQLRIYGCYLLDDLITEDLLQAVNHSFQTIGQTNLSLNHRGLTYAVATEITRLERSFLLEQCGELFDTHFYTTKPCSLSHVRLCGPVKYEDEMPCVFRHSK